MEPEIQRKIEETVIDILNHADMDRITEFAVRLTASERLGIDLSASVECKKFVRQVVESFLLSTVEEGCVENKEGTANVGEENKVQEAMQPMEFDSDGNRIICKLSNRRNVVIQDFRGKPYVAIREFYLRDGKQLPSNKGITLATEQWSVLRKNVLAIEEAIMKIQSKLRSELDGEQNGQISNSGTASTPHEFQNRQISNSGIASNRQDFQNGQTSNSGTASAPHEFLRIEINRFDGKNYQYWASQMELFLKQLKIAYVLTGPCPSVAINPEMRTEEIGQAKFAERKWFNDDYICRHNILNALSDSLYFQYSKKTTSARELWEELKSVYLYEEFVTKRSQVKKYIEFQMVEDKSILDQVQEFNNIADSIVATGIPIDENFHVSTIISKLPPSWKGFSIKLMHEDYLPFWMLMDRVRAEEESRNRDKEGQPSSSVHIHQDKNLGPRIRGTKKPPGLHWKRQETEIDNNKATVCYFCGKKGHISKHCRNKKFDKEADGKHDRETPAIPAVSEVDVEHYRVAN